MKIKQKFRYLDCQNDETINEYNGDFQNYSISKYILINNLNLILDLIEESKNNQMNTSLQTNNSSQ